MDIYTEKGGLGPNVAIGTYTIGDTIKVFIRVSQNCTLEEDLITPDGSVWLRMKGPVTGGTIIDYVDTQYPTGNWTLLVKAVSGVTSASDTAAFEVIDKEPYIYPKKQPLKLDNVSTIEEARFDGKVVSVYRYPVGYVHGWDILIDRVYFGPDIGNLTVQTQLIDIARSPDSPPGYLDYNITLGDRVEVYGLVYQKDNDTSVKLNGSENYYIKTLRTLYRSPEIVIFTREVFPSNLTAKIDGIAVPGSRNVTLTKVNWSWGDGQSSDQQFPATHTYAELGTYIILIKAFQSDGLSTTKSLSITLPTSILSESTRRGGFSMTGELWITSLAAITIAFVLISILTIRFRIRRLSKSGSRNKLSDAR